MIALTINPVDAALAPAQNSRAAVNPADRFGDLNSKADTAATCGIFYVCHTPLVRLFLAGSGGDTFGYAGSLLPVRQPRHAPATLVWRRGPGLTLSKEATMPSIALRTICALIPVSTARRLAFAMYRRDIIRAVTLVRVLGVQS